MANITIGIDFAQLSFTPSATSVGWNKFNGYDPTVVGQVSADLLDLAGSSTGISLHVDSPFYDKEAASGWGDGSTHHGWIDSVWKSNWRGRHFGGPASPGRLRFSGFSSGQSGTIDLAGHNNNSGDTSYSVNGNAAVTYDATTNPPAAPISVPFTADSSGNVTVDVGTGDFGRISGAVINYAESATPPTGIDQLISGETSTATFAEPFPATSATVSDGTTSISGISVTVDGNTVSFTAPAITDLAAGLKLGNVSVTFTDGTDTTAGYSIAYQLSGYTAANITSVSDFALGVYFDPSTQVGDQFAYQADKGTVEANGEWNDGGIDPPFVGTQTLWHYSSVDQTWRDFELTTTGDGSEPEPEPPGDSIGMTRRNITRRASTSRTLTSRGMTS